MPPRQAAVDFLNNFQESNRRVCERWFPTRAALFSDDMSMYPVVEDPPPPFEVAVEIAAALRRELLSRIEQSEDKDHSKLRHRLKKMWRRAL